jgi:hypothetical protein
MPPSIRRNDAYRNACLPEPYLFGGIPTTLQTYQRSASSGLCPSCLCRALDDAPQPLALIGPCRSASQGKWLPPMTT